MAGDVAAIIVAAGLGLRFGRRKQYCQLAGRPLFEWSVRAFLASPSAGAVALVVPKDDVQRVRRQVRRWRHRKPVQVIGGGATRAGSVRAGLDAIPRSYRYVAVHDAVRPLVSTELIEKVLRAARRHRAALAASRARDTVKLARSGTGPIVKMTLPRDQVWWAQTPQIFERKLLARAHRLKADSTDDAQLVERLGVRVKLVESPSENLKVTVPLDLEIARWILNREKVKRKREKVR